MESERESALVLVAERLPQNWNVLALVQQEGTVLIFVLREMTNSDTA